MNLKIVSYVIIRLIVLVVAGVTIHLFQDRDFVMMLILLFFTIIQFYRRRKSPSLKLYYIGFFMTAIGGILAENWGIYNGLWEYHDLPDGRTFPYWLPFAWGLAFTFIYKFEAFFIEQLNIKKFQSKILLTTLCAMFLPLIGEIVTVQLGVWTYYGPLQFFGVPLYAVILLVLFHTTTYLLMIKINQKLNLPDPVFSVDKNTF